MGGLLLIRYKFYCNYCSEVCLTTWSAQTYEYLDRLVTTTLKINTTWAMLEQESAKYSHLSSVIGICQVALETASFCKTVCHYPIQWVHTVEGILKRYRDSNIYLCFTPPSARLPRGLIFTICPPNKELHQHREPHSGRNIIKPHSTFKMISLRRIVNQVPPRRSL
jgi:hypothetical protein